MWVSLIRTAAFHLQSINSITYRLKGLSKDKGSIPELYFCSSYIVARISVDITISLSVVCLASRPLGQPLQEYLLLGSY